MIEPPSDPPPPAEQEVVAELIRLIRGRADQSEINQAFDRLAALRRETALALTVEQAREHLNTQLHCFADEIRAYGHAVDAQLDPAIDALIVAAVRSSAPAPEWPELVDSVRIFLLQWQVVRPVLDAQATLLAVHGMPYQGPTIGGEIERLQRAFDALPPAPKGSTP